MKTLLLLRHAKSDWDRDAGDDHGRPLARRGRQAAERMGRFLRRAGLVPDLVVTSSARRAYETAVRAAQGGGWSAPMAVTDTLYEADAAGVRAVAADQDDAASTLLLVGHEPAFSETLERLTGARCRLPTAGLAEIALPIERWSTLRPGLGELRLLIVPRRLRKRG